MSYLPKDPNMLYSYINMKLRDEYESLEDFCAANDVEAEEILNALAAAGYSYDEKTRQFGNIRPAVIRPIDASHIGRYGEIYAAAFSGEPWNDPWKPEDAVIHVSEIMESKQSYGLEYVEDGKVVGFILGASMLFHYGRTFEINDLAVDPEWQGRGIAKALLEKCIADMKERGMVGLNLITGAEGFLPEFYEKYGFSREDRVILMGREL